MDSQDQTNFADSFAKVKALVVGDLMLDQYWWGSVERMSPEAPVPVVRLDRMSVAAGGAANVAANIAGLGASPLLVGLVGQDSDSQLLVDQLLSMQVSADHLARCNRPTSVKTRVVAHSQHVVRVDREHTEPLDGTEERAISDSINLAMSDADIVVVSDYAKGTLTNEVLRSTFDAAAKHQIPVLVDPKGKDFTKYAGASLLTPNRREALEACRLEGTEPDAVKRAGQQLIEELKLDAVVITEGERGMTLFERDREPINHKAVAHEIFDVTGAGDTVIACIAVALAAGFSRREAVQLANLSAGLVVEQVGTTAVTLQRLLDKIKEAPFVRTKSDAALL